MNLTAQANYIRMSPRKVQLVSRLIAGLPVAEAEAQLIHNQKIASGPMMKLLQSAVANTLSQLEIKKEDLVVKSVMVNQGPTLHRFKPRAFGRAGRIRKRTSHITITLAIRKGADIDLEKAKKKVVAPKKPTSLADIEKAAAKAAKESDSKKVDATSEKKDSAEKKPAVKQQDKHPEPTKGPKKSQGGKADNTFMKKVFSRKVG